ncbi:hypothetical protein DV735_g2884, partial [Chaetothyriales sp. CBS 134920]
MWHVCWIADSTLLAPPAVWRAQPLSPRPKAQPSEFGPHRLLTIGPATQRQQQTAAVHLVQLQTFFGAVICCLSSSLPHFLLQNRVQPAGNTATSPPSPLPSPQLHAHCPNSLSPLPSNPPRCHALSFPDLTTFTSITTPRPRPDLNANRRRPSPPPDRGHDLLLPARPSPNPGVVFEQSGSTSPESFQRLVDDDSYWPQRTPHVSRRTHDAILFALEAIRTGRGVDAHPLTSDLTEERARMSDLLRDNGPSGTPLGRAQNGSGQLPQEAPRMRTPRDVMQQRPGSSPPAHTILPALPRLPRLYLPASQTPRNRTEAFERLNMTATAQPSAKPPAASQPAGVAAGAASAVPRVPRVEVQPGATYARAGSRFPHAFERWEQLSAQWEGLTSHWLRRLQNNASELESKPLEQQMARQIADLSAAGANLFHAVLRAERDARITAQAAGTDAAVRAEKARAEDLVREMRRELQISKEEARRAWEELGRREQEERERTIALRSGEPTLIGGVQVVPMQAIPSRQLTAATSSSQRPPTRDGSTYRAAHPAPGQVASGQQPTNPSSGSARPASRTTSTSLDSPGEEARQFTYQQPHPASGSSTTDPFTEPAPQQPHAEFYPQHSAAAAAAARSTSSPHQSPPSALVAATTSPSAASRFYQQPSPQTTIHQPLGTLPTTSPSAATGSHHARPSAVSDAGRSASVASAEEEYHINPDGSYTLDSSGRRIPYNQPLSEQFSLESEAMGEITGPEAEESDEDYASDIAREQAYAREYASHAHRPAPLFPAQHQQQTGSVGTPSTPAHGSGAHVPSSQATSATSAYLSADQGIPSSSSRQRYDGGWEDVPLSTSRHRHPTRLSDIIEEQTSRTSPSRGSFISGSAAGGVSGPR